MRCEVGNVLQALHLMDTLGFRTFPAVAKEIVNWWELYFKKSKLVLLF